MDEKVWRDHNHALYLAERIRLSISRNKSQYGLIDTLSEMEMPTHAGKSQNKQSDPHTPLQPLNSSITFYNAGNTWRTKLITQNSRFFHWGWYVSKDGFCEGIWSHCGKNLLFGFFFCLRILNINKDWSVCLICPFQVCFTGTPRAELTMLEKGLAKWTLPNGESSSPSKAMVEMWLHNDLAVCTTCLIWDFSVEVLLEKPPACDVRHKSHLSSLLHRNVWKPKYLSR